MKRIALILLLVLATYQVYPWGQIGHRAVGKIATNHLSKKAKKQLALIMGHESLAIASTWMDEIKSDRNYDYMYDWHWVTIPDGQTYESSEKNPNGDVIATLERLIDELMNNRESLSIDKQREYVRIIVHLVGDIHQPLHVGTGLDRGGNDAKVTWFWNTETNLHSVWDSRMIDSKQLSYTELAAAVDHTLRADIEQWQQDGVRDWAQESMSYRAQIYTIPEDGKLSYEYVFNNWATVQHRIHQAGIRLAGVLNKIYG